MTTNPNDPIQLTAAAVAEELGSRYDTRTVREFTEISIAVGWARCVLLGSGDPVASMTSAVRDCSDLCSSHEGRTNRRALLADERLCSFVITEGLNLIERTPA